MFEQQKSIHVQAVFVGQRLDVHAFDQPSRLAHNPLTIGLGKEGLAVLFRYGVVVFFAVDQADIDKFLDGLSGKITNAFSRPELEIITLRLRPDQAEGVEANDISLQAFSLQRFQVVADVLAKSVVLAHYEISLAQHFERIEPLAESLNRPFRVGFKGQKLLRHIGDVLVIEGKMIGRVEVSEKPELIWDYPEHERLFLRLEDYYEIRERHEALEKKLGLLSRTAQTLLEILQSQRTLRVEWYIVFLILVEIVITLVEKL